ncbi:MAG: four helix bundle protein [Thermodesulfobacteriota bacterium]|nr:four helix bundle protein [Thermodesulfobacteriota bacterium]
MFTNWQKRYQIWSGTILISGTKRFKNTVGYQIIRSSDSIAANIAEGYGRYTPADRKKFYLYSRGSLEETKSWLRKLIKRKPLSESRAIEYKAIVEKTRAKIECVRQQYKSIKAKFPISNFNVP